MTVIDVLKQCTVDGLVIRLPDYQLDRKIYTEVAGKLELIGGKWKGGKIKGFVFNEDPTEYLEKLCNGDSINLKKEFQFFATPDCVADRLVELACIESEHLILEPSAGQGAIIKAIHRAHSGVNVDCYELMDLNRTFLERLPNCTLVGEDFIVEESTSVYDRIIANPPFSKNQDIDHVLKMYERLADNGKLICIMSNHWRESSNKKEVAFKEFLWDAGANIHEIEAGAFKESGTNISACIIVLCRTNKIEPPKNTEKKKPKDKADQEHSTYKSPSQALKEFEGYFESLSGRYSAGEIFIDFVDYALLMFKWWERDRDFSYFEKRYGEMFPKFNDMFHSFSEASDDGGRGFRDALGDLFMNLVSHGRNGQYFTPDNICEMMSSIVIPTLKDNQSILDPACGSGRMLLGAAKQNRNAFFFGCDIDTTCCKMAVINLLANSLQGEIALMDSLAMEYTKSWRVSFRTVHGMNLPIYTVIEDKEKSTLWQMHMNSFNKTDDEPQTETEVIKEVKVVEKKELPIIALPPSNRKKGKREQMSNVPIQLTLWD